jgi:hypothetical protein
VRVIQRRPASGQRATKQAQAFFLLDAEAVQPVCLTHASSGRGLTSATQEVLQLAQQILPTTQPRPLLVCMSN